MYFKTLRIVRRAGWLSLAALLLLFGRPASESLAQPQRVADINMYNSASVSDAVYYDDGSGTALYFISTLNYGERASGTETYPSLYRFDGTTTQYIETLSTGNLDLSEMSLVVYDDGTGARLCFPQDAGFDAALGCYDGTSTETIGAFSDDVAPGEFAVLNGELYFRAVDSSAGNEVHVYDGTSVRLLPELNPSGDADPEALTAYTNGTDAEVCYFGASDTAYGLACTDGTSTTLVRAFEPWSEPGFIGGVNFQIRPEMQVMGDRLYFVADDASAGQELFQYDGSTVVLTEEVASGFYNDAFPNGLTAYDDGSGAALHFVAFDGDGYDLFHYDEATGMTSIETLQPYTQNATARVHDVGNGPALYFAGTSPATSEQGILAYDGTSVSTAVTYADGTYQPEPRHLRVNPSTDDLLFFAADPTHGRQWRSLGASGATRLTGYSNDDAIGITFVYDDGTGAALYIGANGGLQRYDGTDVTEVAATRPLSDVAVYDDGTGSQVYFQAAGDSGNELYRFDGSTVELVADIYPNDPNNFSDQNGDPENFVTYDGSLYFTAENGTAGDQVFRYDGTSVEAVTSVDESPLNLTVYNDGSGAALYFIAQTRGGDATLYRYDGTGTTEITANASSLLADPIVYDGALYFVSLTTAEGIELSRYDGSTVELVEDLNPGSDNSSPGDFAVYNDGTGARLFFSATSDVAEGGLFAYDGTSVTQITDADTRAYSNMTVYAGALYFEGNNDAIDTELFRYDGTQVQSYDLFPDGSSQPSSLVVYDSGSGEQLFFSANAGDFKGETLFRYEAGTVFPVELAAFDAVRDGSDVALTWETASETNNAGFHVERSVKGNAFERLAFVDGAGTTNTPQRYRFADAAVPTGAESITYRLRQVDLDGTEHLSVPVTIALTGGQPLALELPFPNPVRGTATLRYSLPASSDVSITVHDLLGREVATLASGSKRAGAGTAFLNTDRLGLASGTYFVRLQANGQSVTQRITVVR